MFKYFKYSEFDQKGLPDSGGKYMCPEFIERLDILRGEFGLPIVVTSGYRSPEYNLQVSSTGDAGPHTTGKAADILVHNPVDCFTLVSLAFKHGFTGIGIKISAEGSGMLHLDTLTNDEVPGLRPRVWTYKQYYDDILPANKLFIAGEAAYHKLKELLQTKTLVLIKQHGDFKDRFIHASDDKRSVAAPWLVSA